MENANCSRLTGLNLLVEKPKLHKSITPAEAVENYSHKLSFVKPEDMNKAYMADSSGCAVLFSIPYENSISLLNLGRTYVLVAVDAASGDILYIRIPTLDSGTEQLRKIDFKELEKCR